MTDCSQLLGQLSDLYCGFTWLPGNKTIIFLILLQYRMVADGGGPSKTIYAKPKLPPDWKKPCLRFYRQIPQARFKRQPYSLLVLLFLNTLCLHIEHTLWSTLPKSIPRQNSSGSTGMVFGACCLSWWAASRPGAPARAVHPGKAVLRGRRGKWDPRLQIITKQRNQCFFFFFPLPWAFSISKTQYPSSRLPIFSVLTISDCSQVPLHLTPTSASVLTCVSISFFNLCTLPFAL